MRKSCWFLALWLPVLALLPAAPARAQRESDSIIPSSPAPPPATATATPAEAGTRPAPYSPGIGFGWIIGPTADLFKPSVASVRFVLTDRFILEPGVVLSYEKRTAMATDQVTTRFSVDAKGRLLLASRGPLDLAALGQAAFGFASTDAGSNVTISNLNFSLDWGLGLTWFFYRSWALSLDATNPFFNWNRAKTDNPDPVPDTTQTNLLFGVIFAPQVTVMVHLYF